jgi:hypothetical protein
MVAMFICLVEPISTCLLSRKQVASKPMISSEPYA